MAAVRRKNGKRLDWSEWYGLARAYRESHGDLLVPGTYETPCGRKLGRWIERQRAMYNGTPNMRSRLDRAQIDLLEGIGMVWKLENRFAWNDWLREAEAYLTAFGDLDVPHEYCRGEYRLGNWIAEQRKNYAAGRLSPEEITDLEVRGIRWTAATPRRDWSDWYADAEEYYKTHGNLLVKMNYKTPEGNRLGVWIFNQRELYRGNKPGRELTKEQIARLNRLDMVWEPEKVRADAWEQMYAWVAEYREKNGKLPLWPKGITAPDGRRMDTWILSQRAILRAGKASPERVRCLSELGIVPPKRRSRPETAAATERKRSVREPAERLPGPTPAARPIPLPSAL